MRRVGPGRERVGRRAAKGEREATHSGQVGSGGVRVVWGGMVGAGAGAPGRSEHARKHASDDTSDRTKRVPCVQCVAVMGKEV